MTNSRYDEKELQLFLPATELLLRGLESPQLNGVRLEQAIEAGESLPDMAVATAEERREMVLRLLEPGGLYYDLQKQEIVAIRPLPAFSYVLRVIDGLELKDDDAGLPVLKRSRRIREIPL